MKIYVISFKTGTGFTTHHEGLIKAFVEKEDAEREFIQLTKLEDDRYNEERDDIYTTYYLNECDLSA